MTTYTARLEREKDGRWTVELEEEPRVHNGGKTVDQALARLREAVALWFQTDEDQIELVPHLVLPKTTGRSVEQARHAREQARNADRLALELTRKAAAALTSWASACETLPPSCASPTREVHQLLTAAPPPRRNAG